ncbi:MAG: hypothetical protein WEC59_10965 [Salibacteraceae bacterium]
MLLKRLFNHVMLLLISGYFIHKLYLKQLKELKGHEEGMLAFALVWMVMLVVLLAFRIQCGFPYPESIKHFKSWETKTFYHRFGVRQFRWILLHSPFKYANGTIYLKQARGRIALERLLLKMEEAEWAHIINAVFVFIASIVMWQLTLWLILWNIVFNIYPIFLQRYHRLKINDILQ